MEFFVKASSSKCDQIRSAYHADLLLFTKKKFNIKLLTFFMQCKDDQLFNMYFNLRSINHSIYPYLKIYMCYVLDVFTRIASVY